jgi:uncharacterized ferredoxin-like protein
MICISSATQLTLSIRTYSSLSHYIENDIQPLREKQPACLSQVEASNAPELDAQALQVYCKNIGHQHDKQQPKSVRGTSCHIRRVIPGVDVSHRDLASVNCPACTATRGE